MVGAGPWRRVEERGGRPVTILVIEDEAVVREVLQITLERSGFRVLMACGGGEALDLCESSAEPIDVV
jgi:CheY-like chemotaxis protein